MLGCCSLTIVARDTYLAEQLHISPMARPVIARSLSLLTVISMPRWPPDVHILEMPDNITVFSMWNNILKSSPFECTIAMNVLSIEDTIPEYQLIPQLKQSLSLNGVVLKAPRVDQVSRLSSLSVAGSLELEKASPLECT